MEEPPQKRLRSGSPAVPTAPLPPGWTEHSAPSGHKYYYHKETKKSTYTRPTLAPPAPAAPAPSHSPLAQSHSNGFQSPHSAYQPPAYPFHSPAAPTYPLHPAAQANAQSYYSNTAETSVPSYLSHPYQAQQPSRPHQAPRGPRPQPNDRPKRKASIPDCDPWILVYTRLGRRFVHNTQTKESFWKFPKDVMDAVIKFDQMNLAEKYGDKKTGAGKEHAAAETHSTKQTGSGANAAKKVEEELDPEELAAHKARESERLARELEEDAALVKDLDEERVWVPPAQSAATAQGYDSSEYEEVEVTDSEGEGPDGGDQEEQDAGPLEFNEDDIAFQLAAMGEQYGLDPEEYGSGEEDEEEGAGGLEFSDEERYEVFAQMLGEYGMSPYAPWEKLVDDAQPHPILDDDRFTVVPSSRGRKEAHARWCKEETARLQRVKKEKKAKGEDDPRVGFLEFMAGKEKEVKKLYWVEFRRKYKREQALKGNSRFVEKDMEKLYREFVASMKKDVGKREDELKAALKAAEKGLDRQEISDEDDLPGTIKADVRFWVVPGDRRSNVIKDWIAGLSQGRCDKGDEDQETRGERAMRERARMAEEGRRRAEKATRFAKGHLRESEREVEAAMKSGRRAQVAE
ncbi:hypothetical protein B9Z65_7515 [Elsinoe australis]|uniref:WW domain-containing protein n=1 Tax=Elsinoe australis TaxID=40998 RepID=A0A2P7YCC6_9PEZI|nr:hypothetical protein B9Z65_7515 [Elsinoe australis]